MQSLNFDSDKGGPVVSLPNYWLLAKADRDRMISAYKKVGLSAFTGLR